MNDEEQQTAASHAAELHGGGGSAPDPVVSAPREKPGSKWGKRVGWILAMSAIGVVVGLAIVTSMKFIDGPVSASSQTITVAQAAATPTPKKNSSELSGLYVDLQYPGVFDRVKRLQNDTRSLEQFQISSSADYTRTIAVDVRPLESGLLTDDASYRIRQLDPSTYHLREDRILGENLAVYVKSDRTEQTLFWPHKGNIVSVSITTSNPKDNVGDFMGVVEPSVRWRQ